MLLLTQSEMHMFPPGKHFCFRAGAILRNFASTVPSGTSPRRTDVLISLSFQPWL